MTRASVINEPELRELYLVQKLTAKEIGLEFGTSRQTIERRLRGYNIPIRPRNKFSLENRCNWRGGERIDNTGHIKVYRRGHHRAAKNGYVPRSILVWEETNLRPFPREKVPHHDNGIPDDDRPENIIPLTQSEHATIHNLRRGGKL